VLASGNTNALYCRANNIAPAHLSGQTFNARYIFTQPEKIIQKKSPNLIVNKFTKDKTK